MNIKDFNRIVDFVLQNRDRAAYCYRYNYNPHYEFSDFDVYHNPYIGLAALNYGA